MQMKSLLDVQDKEEDEFLYIEKQLLPNKAMDGASPIHICTHLSSKPL